MLYGIYAFISHGIIPFATDVAASFCLPVKCIWYSSEVILFSMYACIKRK